MQLKRLIAITVLTLAIYSCKDDNKTAEEAYERELAKVVEEKEILEFGFNINDYVVKRDTIKKGDSFGEILERNNLGYPKIFQIAEKAKDSFDIRRLQLGRPYTLLFPKESKDSIQKPDTFIYQAA